MSGRLKIRKKNEYTFTAAYVYICTAWKLRERLSSVAFSLLVGSNQMDGRTWSQSCRQNDSTCNRVSVVEKMR